MTNPASILDSTKKVLGLDSTDTSFDLDVVMAVNSAFGTLGQLGVGPSAGFQITDNTTLWAAYINNITYLGMVKQFIWMSARLAFDPPGTSFGIDAIKSQIEELTWRINVAAEQSGEFLTGAGITFWDLTGLSDFPDEAVVGDWGLDFDNGDAYSDTSETVVPGMWDLTGLSDFPDGSEVGDIGIDLDSGDVYKRDS
jgi:hypothetical protein